MLLADMVKVTDRPGENCTMGSSAGMTAAGANAIFNVPETVKGYPAESDSPIGNCCAGRPSAPSGQ